MEQLARARSLQTANFVCDVPRWKLFRFTLTQSVRRRGSSFTSRTPTSSLVGESSRAIHPALIFLIPILPKRLGKRNTFAERAYFAHLLRPNHPRAPLICKRASSSPDSRTTENSVTPRREMRLPRRLYNIRLSEKKSERERLPE